NTFGLKPVSSNLFPSSSIPRSNADVGMSAMPTVEKSREEFLKGIPAFEFFHDIGLCATRSEARRLIQQGGAYINDHQAKAFDQKIDISYIKNGKIHARKGKKQHRTIRVL
ncbi:MAG: S4 domain-containing protein, partial [Thermodesulfobacteriota bacterium]|nr:S4 domain-containing protein [Thermodesulfobacteriota bacterium]